MRVAVDDLIRALKNTTLFAVKESQAEGLIEISDLATHVQFLTTDDYIVIRDEIPQTGEWSNNRYYISMKEAKALIKDLEGVEWEEADIEYLFIDGKADLIVHNPEGANRAYTLEGDPNPEFWANVRKAIKKPKKFKMEDGGVYAVRPERLSKFSRIKPGDYPIDINIATAPLLGKDVWWFKAGPTVEGILSPVMRSVLEEAYGDEEGVLWPTTNV